MSNTPFDAISDSSCTQIFFHFTGELSKIAEIRDLAAIDPSRQVAGNLEASKFKECVRALEEYKDVINHYGNRLSVSEPWIYRIHPSNPGECQPGQLTVFCNLILGGGERVIVPQTANEISYAFASLLGEWLQGLRLTLHQKRLVKNVLKISEREFLDFLKKGKISHLFDAEELVRFAARHDLFLGDASLSVIENWYRVSYVQRDVVQQCLQMDLDTFCRRYPVWVEQGKLSASFGAEELVRFAVHQEMELTSAALDWTRRSGLIPEPPLQDFDAFVTSAKNETSTGRFKKWAGDERVMLAIVFTDVVGSTQLGEDIKDEAMNEVRIAHFGQSRKLISQFNGYELKTIGDSFMVVFKSADAALDYALALQENTGHPQVQIRAGIHIGSMRVEEEDVFGRSVNFAARVIGAVAGAEIWLSDDTKKDIDQVGAARHKSLEWDRHNDVRMKGFPSNATLWSLRRHTGQH